MTIFIALWLISGVVGWWLFVRYEMKCITVAALWVALITMPLGVLTLIVGIIAVIENCEGINKTLKRWD